MLRYIKYPFILLLLFCSVLGMSQKAKKNIVQEYMELRSLEGEYPYVYSYTTLEGKMVEHYLYYKKGDRYILALLTSGVDSVKERFYTADVLFERIEKNLKPLSKLRDAAHDSKKFRKGFEDKVQPFNQIGIRYKNLHYNHYQQIGKDDLATIKNETLVAGYTILDFIARFFKEQIPGRQNN